MHICTYVSMYVCMYACMHVCMHVIMYVRMYVCMYVCTLMYIYMYCYLHVTDFSELKAHYHTMLHLMPDQYEITTGKLQNYITDDQICAILGTGSSSLANKMILDCLIKRINCREELLDLCDQLEMITSLPEMKSVINEIRFG